LKQLDELSLFILDFAFFNKEPLHLIISLLFEEKKVTPEETVDIIIKLANNGYLECYKHSGLSGDPYEKIISLDKTVLTDYMETNKTKKYNEYPAGQEFFFQTTDLAYNIINNE
jgi:hypothetical protein